MIPITETHEVVIEVRKPKGLKSKGKNCTAVQNMFKVWTNATKCLMYSFTQAANHCHQFVIMLVLLFNVE